MNSGSWKWLNVQNHVVTPRALEIDLVTFAGAGVAAVVADTPQIAEDALELIDVEWEPLDVVVDADIRVLDWNQKAEDLWGLRPNEVRGKNLLNLDIGLPVDRLKASLRSCVSAEAAYQRIPLP